MLPLEAVHTEASSAGLLQEADHAEQLMAAAEDDLRGLRAQFDRTSDEQAKGELADAALARVEGQIELMRERRRSLDRVEGKLWARRNRLERFLIDARGREWWTARREGIRDRALTSGPIGQRT